MWTGETINALNYAAFPLQFRSWMLHIITISQTTMDRLERGSDEPYRTEEFWQA
jgi:hypothetical protein